MYFSRVPFSPCIWYDMFPTSCPDLWDPSGPTGSISTWAMAPSRLSWRSPYPWTWSGNAPNVSFLLNVFPVMTSKHHKDDNTVRDTSYLQVPYIEHHFVKTVRSQWVIVQSTPFKAELILGLVAWSHKKYFCSSLDGMLAYYRVIPSIKFAGTHLHTWVERGTVFLGKCLARTWEYNTISLAMVRT